MEKHSLPILSRYLWILYADNNADTGNVGKPIFAVLHCNALQSPNLGDISAQHIFWVPEVKTDTIVSPFIKSPKKNK